MVEVDDDVQVNYKKDIKMMLAAWKWSGAWRCPKL